MLTRELIEEPFSDVPYPGDDNITNHPGCLECEEIREYFRGKSWRDLESLDLYPYQALSLFTPEAFHYFLPGYMLATLNANGPALDMVAYGVISLGGYRGQADASIEKHAISRLCLFTKEQREVIAEYLRFIKNSDQSVFPADEDIDFAISKMVAS